MIRFGPAGNSEAFYDQGYKHTWQAPKWIAGLGLNAFEYSFGRGVKLGQATGQQIAKQAQEYGIAMSVHAPYYINLAADGAAKFEENMNYFRETAVAGGYLGAKRIIFHPGSCANCERSVAFNNVKINLKKTVGILKSEGFGDFLICPETMGKINQIGDLQEICELATLDECIYPSIDFGHLNARTLGGIKTKADYKAILDEVYKTAGAEKTNHMHIHFSHIAYTDMGEKVHLTLEDTKWGPFFEPLAQLLAADSAMQPVIICESKGTQAMDAVKMMKMYEAAKNEDN